MSFEKLDSEVRRRQIAQAVLELIGSQGLKGLSVGAVARRVGLVPSALYRHFRSKDEMLNAAFDLFRDKVMGNIRAVCEEAEKPLERLKLLLSRQIRTIRENLAIPRIVFSEGAYGGQPERRARACGILREFLAGVAAIIREGQEEGSVRSDADAATIAVMFLGLIQPAAILWHLTGGEFDVTRHTKHAWRIFREAIGAKRGDCGHIVNRRSRTGGGR